MTVLTLPTAILGIFTLIATIERLSKLLRADPNYRPLNSPRYALDIFQWGYFFVLIIISALISSALARQDTDGDNHSYQIRLLSLPTSVLVYLVATLTLISLVLNWTEWKLPFRFGSTEKGNALKPALFYIIEDVVAVDGEGGIEYRKAFNARYDSSPLFRNLIRDLSVIWMVWFYLLAWLFTGLVQGLPMGAVYAVGWAGPFPLVGLMAVWTIWYVKRQLKAEREHDTVDERTPLLNGEA